MADYEKTKMVLSDVWHVVMLVVLVVLLLGTITWMGLIRCSQLPGWCEVYDPLYLSLTGKKEILIVSGEDGLGNPQLLERKLRDPRLVGVTAHLARLSSIGIRNLQDYDLVIVEKARTMSTKQLQYFIDFADSGGKLVWTGDAGTRLTAEDTPLFEDDIDENAEHVLMSPWARRDGKKAVRFDTVISVAYIGNYCELSDCSKNIPVGGLITETTGNHLLIYGLAEDQMLYVSNALGDYRDFAVVKEPESIGSKRILTLDYGSILRDRQGNEFGRYFPVIVTSGVGEKIAYYAQPIEQFSGRYYDYTTGREQTGPLNLLIANLYKFYRK